MSDYGHVAPESHADLEPRPAHELGDRAAGIIGPTSLAILLPAWLA
jgi:hypothetical protein